MATRSENGNFDFCMIVNLHTPTLMLMISAPKFAASNMQATSSP